jgi:Cys-tRNA synthase (O-phospho-L-seryl-tRNA:Cys-tRNA synthase)
LQNHGKTTRLNAVRKTMNLQPLPPKVIIPVAQRMLEQFGTDINLCPKCNKGRLVLVRIEYPKLYATAIPLSTNIGQPIALHNKDSPAGNGQPSP